VFERFTDRARYAVVVAQEEARLRDDDHIGVEHILLALAADPDSAAGGALAASGVTLDWARAAVAEVVPLSGASREAQIPFTPAAKKVLELSLREALGLGHDYIGSGHVLLGLLRADNSTVARTLERLEVDPDQLRRDVMARIEMERGAGGPQGAEQGRRPAAARPVVATTSGGVVGLAGRTCSFCGRPLSENADLYVEAQARICVDCVRASTRLIDEAQTPGAERRGTLRLPPRLQGDPPTDDAFQKVVEAFTVVFDPDRSDDERAGYLEDAPTLLPLDRRAREHYPDAGAAVIHNVRFVAADRAHVRFGITMLADLLPQEGWARRHDDGWQVSSETFCRLLQLAGVPCPPEPW
jgi:hypothetical protein